MRQSVPVPRVIAQSGTAVFAQSSRTTMAEYFYKDVVWEIIDYNCRSVCY